MTERQVIKKIMEAVWAPSHKIDWGRIGRKATEAMDGIWSPVRDGGDGQERRDPGDTRPVWLPREWPPKSF